MNSILFEIAPLFQWLLKSTLQVSVVIIIVFAVKAIFSKKLTSRWHYILWMLVIAKMVMPVSLQSSFSLFNLMPISSDTKKAVVDDHASSSKDSNVIEQMPLADNAEPVDTVLSDDISNVEVQSSTDSIAINDITSSNNTTAAADTQGIDSSQPVTIEKPEQQRTSPAANYNLDNIMPYGWLIGAGLLSLYVLASNYKLWRIIRVQRPVTDSGVLDLLEDCKAQMDMHAYLAVVETDKVTSPALYGFLRPRLLLPTGILSKLNKEQLRHVFLHELAHLKRGDIYFGWLTALLQTLHWFNPLVWYAFHRMRVDRELACDELAISAMKSGENNEYGKTIVSLLEEFSAPKYTPGLAGILEEKSQLRHRISMIASGRKGSTRLSVFAAVLMMVIGGVALTDASQEPKPLVTISANSDEVILENGTRIELLGLCEQPLSKESKWWKQNGEVLREAPFDDTGDKCYPKEGESAYVLAIKYSDIAPTMVSDLRVDGLCSASGGTIISYGIKDGEYLLQKKNGKLYSTVTYYTVVLPKEQTSCNLDIYYTEGEWETEFKTELGNLAQGTVKGSVVFGEPYIKDGKATVSVSDSIGGELYNRRIIAKDTYGNIIEPCKSSGRGSNSTTQTTVSFDCKLSDIESFEFQTRKYKKIRIENIVLKQLVSENEPGKESGLVANAANVESTTGNTEAVKNVTKDNKPEGFTKGVVYVMGKVSRPGPYSMTNDRLTLKQMIATVGGPNGVNPDKAMVKLEHQNEDETSEIIKVSMTKLFAKDSKDYPLQADDVIYVYSSSDGETKPSDIFNTYTDRGMEISANDIGVVVVNGVKVELLGVLNQSQPNMCWTPDGTVLDEMMLRHIQDGTYQPKNGRAVFEFTVKLSGLPEDNSVKIKASPYLKKEFSALSPISADGENYDHYALWQVFNQMQDKCDLTVSVACGEWRTVGIGKYNDSEHIVIKTEDGVHDGVWLSPLAEKPVKDVKPWTKSPVRTVVSLTHGIMDKDVRLIAVGKDGTRYQKAMVSGAASLSQSFSEVVVTTCQFDLAMKDIDSLELQVRPYRSVTFTDVQLKAGGVDDVISVSQPSGKYITDIGYGASIKFLGLRNWKTGECFAIDGSPIAQFDFKADWTPKDERDFDNKDFFELVTKVSGVDSNDLGLIKWNFGGMLYSSNANTKPSYYEDGVHVGTVVMPGGLSKANLRLGLAVEPWHTIISCDHMGYFTNDKCTVHVVYNRDSSFDGLPVDSNGHAIKVTYTATQGQFRVIAIDKDGNTHYSTSSGSTGTDQLRQTVAYFKDLKNDYEIEYQFQVRNYDWINVDNISLCPGRQSNVVVDVLDRQESAERFVTNSNVADIGLDEKIILAGVTEWPVPGKKWWSLDGTLMEKNVTDSWPGNDGSDPDDGEISRVFAFKVDGLNPNEISLKCNVPNGNRLSYFRRYDDRDSNQMSEVQGIVVKFKDDQQYTDITVGVGTGPWLTTSSAGQPGMSGSTGDNIFGRTVLLEKPTESNGWSKVEVKHLIDKQYVCRIIAHGKDGKNYYPESYSNLDSDIRTCHATFNMKLDEIKSFGLQARLRRYVTFKNVALFPNQFLGDNNETSQPKTYIVEFKALASVCEKYPKGLIDILCEGLAQDLELHKYAAHIDGVFKTGIIHVDTEKGKDILVEHINKSEKLKLIRVRQATESYLEKLNDPEKYIPLINASRPNSDAEVQDEVPVYPPLDKLVSVDIDHSPKNTKLSVQYGVIAICEAAGVGYDWDTSGKLADPERRKYIPPIHFKNKNAHEAINEIITPLGLSYGIKDGKLYLYKKK